METPGKNNGKTEFIIALTEHRFLGNVFLPYLIQKEEQFYTIVRLVKKRDLNDSPDYHFNLMKKNWSKSLKNTAMKD